MSELSVTFRPELRRPVLVAAFRGWNDGGQGASLGGAYLAKQWEATRFAEIDPEGFYDFQATRPQVSLVDGLTRQLDWPENAFYHAPIPGTDRDAVILLGVEPNLRWKTFSNLVLDLSKRARHRDARHARLAARRRAAHEAGPGDRRCDRPGDRLRPRARAVALRGTDGHRRRRARRLPRRGHSVGQPLGSRPALRVARAEPACRARARAPSGRALADRHRPRRARGRRRRSTANR